MYTFNNHSMYKISKFLQKELLEKNKIIFQVLNPDFFNSTYAGTKVKIDGIEYIYRSYKAWNDLASKLFCRVLTPKKISEQIVELTFQKLDLSDSFHEQKVHKEEKYGKDSIFSKINKNEEPEILLTYLEALKNVKIETRKRVLNLGVNSGEEFELIKKSCKNFKDIEFVGVDYCQSIITFAKQRFINDKNVRFYNRDINDLDNLDLGRFDLIISIGTLQSSNLNFNKIFMKIVQKYLKKDGSIIVGFPNSRWIDGEIIYGAKVPNYSFSEMSILFKDVVFCKKYLQQKKFRVTLTGKYYIFLTATSIKKN